LKMTLIQLLLDVFLLQSFKLQMHFRLFSLET